MGVSSNISFLHCIFGEHSVKKESFSLGVCPPKKYFFSSSSCFLLEPFPKNNNITSLQHDVTFPFLLMDHSMGCHWQQYWKLCQCSLFIFSFLVFSSFKQKCNAKGIICKMRHFSNQLAPKNWNVHIKNENVRISLLRSLNNFLKSEMCISSLSNYFLKSDMCISLLPFRILCLKMKYVFHVCQIMSWKVKFVFHFYHINFMKCEMF